MRQSIFFCFLVMALRLQFGKGAAGCSGGSKLDFAVRLDLPAGKLEYGEDPFEAGKRELREETGTIASEYEDLGKLYPTPGYCGEIIHMYFAKGLSFTSQDLDDDEFLEVRKIPLEKAYQMVMNNEIRDSKTQVGIMKVYHKVYGDKK